MMVLSFEDDVPIPAVYSQVPAVHLPGSKSTDFLFGMVRWKRDNLQLIRNQGWSWLESPGLNPLQLLAQARHGCPGPAPAGGGSQGEKRRPRPRTGSWGARLGSSAGWSKWVKGFDSNPCGGKCSWPDSHWPANCTRPLHYDPTLACQAAPWQPCDDEGTRTSRIYLLLKHELCLYVWVSALASYPPGSRQSGIPS